MVMRLEVASMHGKASGQTALTVFLFIRTGLIGKRHFLIKSTESENLQTTNKYTNFVISGVRS